MGIGSTRVSARKACNESAGRRLGGACDRRGARRSRGSAADAQRKTRRSFLDTSASLSVQCIGKTESGVRGGAGKQAKEAARAGVGASYAIDDRFCFATASRYDHLGVLCVLFERRRGRGGIGWVGGLVSVRDVDRFGGSELSLQPGAKISLLLWIPALRVRW